MLDSSLLSKLISCLAVICIPATHIFVLYVFWDDYAFKVDKNGCRNECWDTVFKGPYENGVSRYKHFFFNATSNTLKIWMSTIISVLCLYESGRYLMELIFHRKIRITFLVLFCWSIFSNYYSWWGYVNYWNDEFYSQWNHQLYFTITELISSIVILSLCDKSQVITRRKILAILSIAFLHILTGGYDQFVQNVIFGEGERHQVVRDVFFMSGDLVNFALPLYELFAVRHHEDWRFVKKDLAISLISVLIGFIIYSNL